MKYFSIDELLHSDKADELGISNKPSPDVVRHLTALVDNVLDPVRILAGKPLVVSSGFRCPRLNAIVGGKPNSQHLKGMAADISLGSALDNRRLFDLIVASSIPFDQLIDESRYLWLHISFDPLKARQRRQILHLS